MKLRIVAAFVIATALGVAALVSCDDVESYLYSAQKFDPANACVAGYAPLEIVKGSGANANCPPACFTSGGETYVSTMCPPLPPSAEPLEPDAGECIAAIAAMETPCGEAPSEEDSGGEEAGEEDAGSDPDAGEEDAPADVRTDG